MGKYRCRISNDSGQTIEKIEEAESKFKVIENLKGKGYFVFNVTRINKNIFSTGNREKLRKLKKNIFLSFNHELRVLIKAGLPIVSALDTITDQEDEDGFIKVIKKIRKNIKEGESLSASFSKYPKLFPKLYIAIILSGEKSGDIPSAIDRYIIHFNKAEQIKNKIISASIYPLFLGITSFLVLIFMLMYVVPAITGSFTETGTDLPALTKMLLNISENIKSYISYFIFFSAALILYFIFYIKTYKGRLTIDKTLLNLPFFGKFITIYITSIFSRTLATLLTSGTSLMEAVKIASNNVNNLFLKIKLEEVIISLGQGVSFSNSINNIKIFPKLAQKMILAGENSGALEKVLIEIADFFDNETDTKIAVITSAIEPALMVVMGLLIGTVVLALYMPIFELAATI